MLTMQRYQRYFMIASILLLVVSIIMLSYGFYRYRSPLPQIEGDVQVEGLRETVTIYRDEWGIPNIYAGTEYDLFFTQGYTHAQDRWWQMEVARYVAQGRFFEIAGEGEDILRLDQFIRTVGWQRIAENYWEAATPETRNTLRAYADGVNAYIENRSESELAMEYAIMSISGRDLEVEPWEPVHSLLLMVAMAWSQENNFEEEILRAELHATLEPELLEAYLPDWGIDSDAPTIIPVEALPTGNSELPPLPPIFPPDIDYTVVNRTLIGDLDPQTLLFIMRRLESASNAWVVDGNLTVSGQPLLATDMQTGVTLPSPWYINGLHCIDLNEQCPYEVIGYSLPGVPAVLIGHNHALAWTLSTAHLDTQDLYLIQRNPDNPAQYQVDGEWRDAEIREEALLIDEDEPLLWEVYQTDYGPIISIGSEPIGLALQWSADTPIDPLQAILMMNRSADRAEFEAALRLWEWSPYHVLYADQSGTIGYQMVGRIPVRSSQHSGLAPVPGWESGYRWRGYLPFETLPRLVDPAQGWIVAAGQAPVPAAYAGWLVDQLGTEFGNDANYYFMLDSRSTSHHIAIMLTESDAHTLDEFALMLGDTDNPFAASLLELLDTLDLSAEADADLLAYRNWLHDWDFASSSDSPQAALMAILWAELSEAVFADELGELSEGLEWERAAILNLLPGDLWWDSSNTPLIRERRSVVLRSAFRAAITAAESELGTVRDDWQWGSLHQTQFINQPVGYSNIGELVNRGDVPTSGSIGSINATRWSTLEENRYETITLPAFRLLIDMGSFSESRGILSTGQSGHPASDHYADMIDLWQNNQYVHLHWEPTIIRERAVSTLQLQP